MFLDWQTIVSILIVGLAAYFVLRQVLRVMRGGQVSGCGNCPAKTQSRGRAASSSGTSIKALPLVQLQAGKQDNHR